MPFKMEWLPEFDAERIRAIEMAIGFGIIIERDDLIYLLRHYLRYSVECAFDSIQHVFKHLGETHPSECHHWPLSDVIFGIEAICDPSYKPIGPLTYNDQLSINTLASHFYKTTGSWLTPKVLENAIKIKYLHFITEVSDKSYEAKTIYLILNKVPNGQPPNRDAPDPCPIS